MESLAKKKMEEAEERVTMEMEREEAKQYLAKFLH